MKQRHQEYRCKAGLISFYYDSIKKKFVCEDQTTVPYKFIECDVSGDAIAAFHNRVNLQIDAEQADD